MRPVLWAFAAILAIWLPGAVQAAEIVVPDDYSTIQSAIAAAAHGDTVVVRPGTYLENIDFLGKAITVRSERGPAVTVIDGTGIGSVATFWTIEGPDSVLEGFTLTNGDSHGLGGGGVYCTDAKPTITGNVITGNAENGVHCFWNGLGTVTENVIELNAENGIACVDTGGTIKGNIIRNNGGAGIRMSSSEAVIADNIIGLNSEGGIRCLYGYFDSELTNNVIYGNTAQKGGGIYWNLSSVVMTNNTLVGNQADSGGGIYCEDTLGMVVTNTISWDNTAAVGPEIYVDSVWFSSTFTISYSNVKNGQLSLHATPSSFINWGAGMIDAVPMFADAAEADFHLTHGSPCRGAGDPAAPAIPAFDFEGDPRDAQLAVDIGADEFYTHLYHLGSPEAGSQIRIRITGRPGVPVRLAMGAGVREQVHVTPYGNLYLTGPLNLYSAGDMPISGIRTIRTVIPNNWIPGESKAFQAMVGSLGDPDSELTNLMILSIE